MSSTFEVKVGLALRVEFGLTLRISALGFKDEALGVQCRRV